MNKTLFVKEIAIAIATQASTPALLNLDFLKYSGTIPTDWELAQPPTQTATTTQLTFRSGVTILSQVNRIVFGQPVDMQHVDQISVAAIAQKYIAALPQMNYRSVSIHLIGYVPFAENLDANRYLFETFLRPGAWQTIGETQAEAALQFTYTLEKVQLTLNIRAVTLGLAQKEVPTVLFTANFNHPAVGEAQSERLQAVAQAIEQWQTDLSLYQTMIKTQFLQTEGDRAAAATQQEPTVDESRSESEATPTAEPKQSRLQVSVTPLP
jgi:hypothetical protein